MQDDQHTSVNMSFEYYTSDLYCEIVQILNTFDLRPFVKLFLNN